MTASTHSDKSVFYFSMEAAMQDVVERGLTVGGKHVPWKSLGPE